jgi:hypothetical protein
MPLDADAPQWARELVLAYESGAHGQFILHGNVHDRLPVGGRLVNLWRYLQDELLSAFDVVFTYDPGNGLRIERGGALVQQWGGAKGLAALPREPLAAAGLVSQYLRYLANLRALERGGSQSVAVILRGADQVLPVQPAGLEHGALASLVKDWAGEPPYCELPFASFLVAGALSDIDPLVALNPRVDCARVPLPDEAILLRALELLHASHPAAFGPDGRAKLPATATGLVGVTIAAVESLVKRRAFQHTALAPDDWLQIKKQLVESDTQGLVEFIESNRTLADYHGQEALKSWLRQDVALWQAGEARALPMGYLICGPVGTGKTYLVECLAGEAGVPVVKLKNFRDRWVGSSEGNLEKIFRLIRALGRCMVFVDEADQALGQRQSGAGDSGLSGRLYAMIAQEMSDSRNRGRVMWLLASSRPDLIEVDLKRPGRVDIKVPLLPTTTVQESARLVAALCRRYGLELAEAELAALEPQLPLLLTPGAAEALAVKVYRLAKTRGQGAAQALEACLAGYQPPVPSDVLEFQMRLAIREATDLAFVPESLRPLAGAAAS